MKRIFGFIGVLLLLVVPLYARTMVISYSDEVKFTTQHNTGTYSSNNCGAASIYSCLNYIGIDIGSVSEIRNRIKPYDGWIYTDEVSTFLYENEIPYKVKFASDTDTIVKALNDGVVMLCLDASKISNKGYDGITGHFVVITGYREDVNGKYFEVCDPMNYEVKYYKVDEVFSAVDSWWRCFFLFEKTEQERK